MDRLPLYKDASYGGETIALENQFLRVQIHKRVTGWGWGELFHRRSGGGERFFAVLDHLGEVDVAGYPHPMRLEASEAKLQTTECGSEITFQLLQQTGPVGQVFDGSSPFGGYLRLSLPMDQATLRYHLEAVPRFAVQLRSLRGVWLRVGADSFGSDRHDAIFPGIEWVTGDEWSSGTEWFEHPEALRVAPHPHKVSIPIMALSHGDTALGLSWNPRQAALSHLTRIRCPQPVFAAPNFVDRRSHHLLGLMYPSSRWGLRENELKADPPVHVPKGLRMVLDAEVTLVPGTSMDVIMAWVKRHGMPNPGRPRYRWDDALERIAKAYNSNLWTEGKGFGFRGQGSTGIPAWILHYLEHGTDAETIRGLEEKIDWCRKQARRTGSPDVAHAGLQVYGEQDAREIGEKLLAIQRADGGFPFDPEGMHRTNLTERAALWRPLGLPGDCALDICVRASGALVMAGAKLGEGKFLEAGRRGLEYAMRYERPEGGDWWETPLHSPNLLAAGNAAAAYFVGYRQFGDERYLMRARHWIRCLIPFTHLWEPGDQPMIYNTKPCFNTTCWFLSDWTAKHVQWEVLTVFAASERLGIDWAQVDPDIDWATYQRGVTTAVLRWMIDHRDPDWLSRSEYDSDSIRDGAWDALFADTFDPVSGTYGGGPIMPEVIAANVLMILKRENHGTKGKGRSG